MGTDNAVLAPPTFARADPAYGSWAARSRTWFSCFVVTTGPAIELFRSMTGLRRRSSANAGGALCMASSRNSPPSNKVKLPNWALQMRTAFASNASNTGSSSPGELEITRRTSEVAVCCSRDSLSSLVRCCSASNSRTFSMAITAWSAKVATSSICLSVNGRTVRRDNTMTPIGIPSRSRGTPSIVRMPPIFVDSMNSNSGSARTSAM